MRTTTLAALFAGLVFTGTATAGPFKVGFSNVELTPLPPGVTAHLMTDGPQAQPDNYPDGFNLGLTVRAVYIANATGAPQPVVLVSADLINLCAADSDFARDPSHYDDPNLTRERILISITHTHTAPAACDTSMRVQATASSTFDLTRLAYAAINGDRKGIHWSSDPTTGSGWQDGTYDGYPDHIVIDFKTPRTIDEIHVFSAQDAVDTIPPVEPTETMTSLQYGIRDFEVQYWESSRWPARWITIASVTNNDKVWRKFTFPPLTTMKIRVVITASRDHWTRIVEIEAWGNATSRPNVALRSNGACAVGSSELDGNRPATAAINGDRKGAHWGSDPATGSGWHDATMGNFTDDWLQVTFAGPRRINEINVFGVQDVWTNPSTPTETMTCTVVGLIDFQVQYRNGTQWTLVPGGNVTNNNLCWRKFTFVPIETSQIRVVVTNGANYYSRIAELEALTPYDFLSSVLP